MILNPGVLSSFVGSALVMPWKSEPALLVALTTAVVLGKALGGVVADRFGFGVTGTVSLLASLPLLLFAGASPAAGIAGLLLFNMTMPITLVGIVNAMPERPGFGFGLTCLALIAGALPPLLRVGPTAEGAVLATAVLASAGVLTVAFRSARPDVADAAPRLQPQEA